jgi:hypothetical protein
MSVLMLIPATIVMLIQTVASQDSKACTAIQLRIQTNVETLQNLGQAFGVKKQSKICPKTCENVSEKASYVPSTLKPLSPQPS